MDWIGRYRIDAEIGEGAMAQVYLAHDPSIDRPVAIKVLKAELRRDPEIVQRFLGESRAAGILSHAHIVTVYDVGEADGVPYIAMEHLQGRPLDEILKEKGRLDGDQVLMLGRQLADALAFAHGRGVIHRDVKPSNILVCDDGSTAKLLDFGIARVDARDTSANEREVQQTKAGQVMGTPRYMSPEQAMGLPVDARADQFSLGAVLYEMVTGGPAFPATGLANLAIQIAQQDPPAIANQVNNCPRGLEFIIGKLLSKKASDRFADAAQARDALTRELEAATQQREAPRHGMALRIKLPLTFALAAAVALTFGVTLVLERQSDTLERMALTSGSSMTDFVARNAALLVADNAGLPADQQDWLPLQAFVETAARDRNIRNLVVVDDKGVVRAAGSKSLVGTRHQARAAQAGSSAGYRFTRPVRYAGADFGKVHMDFDRSAIDAAMRDARLLLFSLSLFVIAVIAAIGYLSARQLSRPLRSLSRAMGDAAKGNTAFRLSHKRTDEVGQLFDAFNRLVASIEERTAARGPVGEMQEMLMTRVGQAPSTGASREAA